MLKIKTRPIYSSCSFLTDYQIGDAGLWDKPVAQFRERKDVSCIKFTEWKGEFRGKIMRGAALICGHTRDDKLYATLEKTVCDMLSLCTDDGITSYSTEKEFTGYDIWCRKYVAVGLEYFYDICRSTELKQQILRVLKTHLPAIAAHVGAEDGKKDICKTSCYRGGFTYFTKAPIVYALDKRYSDLSVRFNFNNERKPKTKFVFTPLDDIDCMTAVKVKYDKKNSS